MTTHRCASALTLVCALVASVFWVQPVRAMGPPPKPTPPPAPEPMGPGVAARNVIIVIGDGMGQAQVELARRFSPGEELAMDRLDANPSLVTTFSADAIVTDSAAAATALATGVKTVYGAVGVDADLNPVETVLERAEANGKTTGLITDVMLAGGTPSPFSAHTDSRSNRDVIVEQQVGNHIEVMLGGGKAHYIAGGCCGSGFDWIEFLQTEEGGEYEYVTNATELEKATAPNGTLLGFLGGGLTISYELDQQNDPGDDSPSLAELAEKAIEVLDRNEAGFFMMLEGGSPDWVAHNRDVAGMLAEILELDEAVQAVLDFANDNPDTLVVVTADHECGGFAADDPEPINEDFLRGISATTDWMWQQVMSGAMTYEEVLEEFAGIGDEWPALTNQEKKTLNDFESMGIADVLSARVHVTWRGCLGECPGVGSEEGDHTDGLVHVFATGPGSELFDQVTDNTHIGQLLLDAVSGP